MTSPSKRKVKLTASEVGFAKKNDIPLVDLAKAKLPKRGRPKGSKNKPKNTLSPRAAAARSFKRSREEAIQNLLEDNLKLIGDNKQLLNAIENLEHQVIGFRAVISYLENRLGLASSQ